MILGFKKQFIPPILAGTKIHTIREDRGERWQPGRIIHMATGVRTKAYKMFCEAKCVAVQKIDIEYFGGFPAITIDGKILLTQDQMNTIARNDGFDSLHDFLCWFDKDFHGRLIHWTTKRY